MDFIDENERVMVHEGDKNGKNSGSSQSLHSLDQLGKRGGGGEKNHGKDPQTRLDNHIPEDPEAALRDGKSSKAQIVASP
jgi:hypothetical protein